jgi:LmbE family N-acetylglucosaminyl deacetylase
MNAYRSEPPNPGPALFLSPHFDDAVLSCGCLIAATAGNQVLTVFSGGPARVNPLPLWDRECGFQPGDDVVGIRTQEDDAALALLGARAERLGFWDDQYRGTVGSSLPSPLARLVRRLRREWGQSSLVRQVADRIGVAITELGVSTCFIPLGVSHIDHRLTNRAALTVASRTPATRWVVYEDLPYASESSTSRADAIDALSGAGFALSPFNPGTETDEAIKRAAVDCYASQLRGLGTRAGVAVTAPERYSLLLAAGDPQQAASNG